MKTIRGITRQQKGNNSKKKHIRPQNLQKGCLTFCLFKDFLRLAWGQIWLFWCGKKNASFCRKEANVDQRSPPSMEGGDLWSTKNSYFCRNEHDVAQRSTYEAQRSPPRSSKVNIRSSKVTTTSTTTTTTTTTTTNKKVNNSKNKKTENGILRRKRRIRK